MTAFSSAEKTEGNLTVHVEIRSYNNRYLDMMLRIPPPFLSLEEGIKRQVTEKVTRGRIELRLQIKDESDNAWGFEIDRPKAMAYHRALVQMREMFHIKEAIPLNMLSGMIKPAEAEKDMEAHGSMVADCVNTALDDLNEMRQKEGDFIARDFAQRLDGIERAVHQLERDAQGLLSHYQERLKERITALTQGIVETDPGRIAQEAAFLADRSDISEEIVRAKSHIQQFRTVMDSQEPSGRKLNFLLQEMNREFNTMGSKAGNATFSHTIVNVKSELEKIREQVQNVE